MPKSPLTRRQALALSAPLVAALPVMKYALGDASAQSDTVESDDRFDHDHTHAAHIGAEVPAPGGPNDLDDLLNPPPALAHQPGRLREYDIVAVDREIEIAPGVFFPAWTYNGTVPGPIIRATETTCCASTFATLARTRTRFTSTASIRPTWMASSRSWMWARRSSTSSRPGHGAATSITATQRR